MRPWNLPGLALLLGLSSLALVACDDTGDGLNTTRTPLLRITPSTGFLFPQLGVGESAERQVELLNAGAADLIAVNLELRDRSTAGEYQILLEQGGERRPLPERLVLAPDQRALLVVIYSTADESPAPDRGSVTFATNDPQNLDVELPIVAGESGGEIDVSPRTLDFGAVEAGESAVETISVQNIGRLPLTISGVSVNGPADFSARLGDRLLTGGGAFEPIVIEPDGRITIDVTYAPPSAGPDQGQLIITSDDPQRPTENVNLVANGAAACLRVVPDAVEFGAALLVEDRAAPTPNRQLLSVESCGSTPLRVDRFEFQGGDAFDLAEPFMVEEGEPLILLPAATPGEAFPSQPVPIGFWPVLADAYGGTLLIHSNAEDSPTRVQLFGRGVNNTCPIPDVTEETYQVQPLDIITLDGSPSVDPGGQVVEWEWSVVERPDGSVSAPLQRIADLQRPADGGDPDDTSDPTAQFFVDLAGRYVIDLRVKDNLGQYSCDPVAYKRVTIEAVPDKDLHVQLVWSTPDDPDETDRIGTDVDLHFKHGDAGASWNADANGYDCYFANVNPDWGIAGDAADNPSLDIDDTNGAGPENVNLNRPEPGVTYEVGAIYFRAESTFGVAGADPRLEHPSYVTARIFVRGELLVEEVAVELTTLRQLWRIATIRWCEDSPACPEIIPVGEVLTEDQYSNR